MPSYLKEPENAHYIFSYIGTQSDKISEALNGLFDLLNNMAESKVAFQDSKNAIINKIRTERITKESLFWQYERERRLGMDDHDYRRDIFEKVPDITFEDMRSFFDEYIKNKKYNILVLGDVGDAHDR